MLTSVFLEALNGLLFLLSATAVAVFGRYVAIEWYAAGCRFCGWPSKARAAFGILIVFIGESIIRGWVWWWRNQLNDGEDVAWMTGYPVLLVGGAISAIGVLCVIRHFSPERWQNWAWLLSLLFALASGTLIWIAAT